MARVRQQQKNIHRVIRDITWQMWIARRVRRPAVRPMVARPVSVVVIYRPGHQGPMGPDRTRIPAIVITDFMADLFGIIRTVNCRLGSV